jgi:uncharacterized protein
MIMTLRELLHEVLNIKGVTSVVVASAEGTIVEGLSQDGRDLGSVTGLITGGLASSKALADLFGEGEVTQVMIEYESGPVLLTPLKAKSGGFVGVVTLEPTARLERARFELQKLLPALEAVLS